MVETFGPASGGVGRPVLSILVMADSRTSKMCSETAAHCTDMHFFGPQQAEHGVADCFHLAL
jgi:hypothetical protein